MKAPFGVDHLAVPILRDRYYTGARFEELLGTVEKNVELWQAMWRYARVDDEYVRRVSSLSGSWHLLVLSEDWCGDAVNTVPVVARLAERCPNVDLRVLARDANPDIMDAHLTGRSRSIPVIIVLDDACEERGWWGPRPTALQRWVSGQGQLLEKTTRYREARTWYARDRGRTTLEEVVSMLERAAAARVGTS
jgi:Thioredoxin